MSTISSNVDLSTKYQRIAAEYAKLKAQIPVLKNAFISEQEKSRRLTEEMHSKVAFMRKLEGEIESLEFRNEQLLKRVQTLQAEVGESRKVSAKDKKKNVPHGRIPQISNVEDDFEMMRNELEIKIRENQFLHSRIEELNNNFEREKKLLLKKCVDLSAQNGISKADQEAGSSDISCSIKEVDSQCGQSASEQSSVSSLIVDCKNGTVQNGDVENTLLALLSDAVQKAQSLFQNFVNILHLFEQRTTVYPNDMTLEPLPESTLTFGQLLLKSGRLFDRVCAFVDDVCGTTFEGNTENHMGAKVSEFIPVFTEAVKSCQDWGELFKSIVESENRVSWCGPILYNCNEEWCLTFLNFLNSLSALADVLANDRKSSVDAFVETLIPTSQLFSECAKLYSQKLFNENRLPTASKKLKCLNDCIGKCFASASRNFENFVVLLKLIVSTYGLRFANNASQVTDKTNNCEVVPTSSNSFMPENQLSQKETEEEGNNFVEPSDSCRQCICDDLQRELQFAKSRISELEKEKDRILVQTELLKMKLTGNHLESNGCALVSNALSDELLFITSFYDRRIGELADELQHLQSRASYYQNECANFLRRAQIMEAEKIDLVNKLSTANGTITKLSDDLETTQKGYEEQMKSLYEHMGELNAKIESQSETILSLKNNSVSGGIKQGSRKLLFK